MNKRWLVVLSCVGAVLLSGCSKGPTATVEAYFDALLKEDFKQAFSYVDASSVEAAQVEMKASMEQTQAYVSMMPPEQAEQITKMAKLADVSAEEFFAEFMKISMEHEEDLAIPKVVSEKIDGDKASLMLVDDEGNEEPIGLIKKGGKWVIQLIPPEE
jgi:PBP1b-binding outer membrane lipoprotein LpoB